MAGYSGTPLAKKLGIKPGFRVTLRDAPPGWTVPEPPEDITWLDPSNVSSADIVIAFFWDTARYRAEISELAPHIRSAAALWVAWPRKAAGHVSDLGDVVIRDIAVEHGLVDTKVAALGEDWSGLRFVRRLEHRGTD